ncbi:MAG: hypothetical protein LBL73_01765 [Synergistaceae bacterium]|nr:hypothetical protein [Synergistaceae bacterium]
MEIVEKQVPLIISEMTDKFGAPTVIGKQTVNFIGLSWEISNKVYAQIYDPFDSEGMYDEYKGYSGRMINFIYSPLADELPNAFR